MAHSIATTLLGFGLAGLLVSPGSAQDWRRVTSFRQVAGEARLDVHVRYGAGELRIRRGEPGELYRVGLRYDADLFDPITEYRNGRLEVGVEGTGRKIRLRDPDAGELTLSLSPDVPLELDLEFGAVEADLKLGGLRISRMEVHTGASDTNIEFDAPNPLECERFDLAMGAAAFRADGLGHLNCARHDVEGGVGDITLDFSGRWRRSTELDINMALGSVTLFVPDDIGVRVEKDTFLTDFGGSRFTKRDGVHYSDNWSTAPMRLTIDLRGAFGSFDIVWIRPTAANP